MSTDFTMEFLGDHVHVQLASDYEITPEGMARHWAALVAFSEQHECRRVLSEAVNPRRSLSTIDAYDSGVSVARGGAGLRMACCWQGYTPDEMTAFFQNVAANRGITIRWFTDRVEALEWLAEGSSPRAAG